MSPVFYRQDRPHRLRDGTSGRVLPHVELEILRGRAQNRVRPVKVPAFLIGSATDCDLVLGDNRFPEAHSYLLVSPNEVALRWLGVGPRVTVNNEPVDKARLADGDHLQMGPYHFRIAIHQLEAPPEEAEPRILRLDRRRPPDDRGAAGREIRGLLAEIREAVGVKPLVQEVQRAIGA
jgi:Inner membrane component of T3SS, cytoplasmic domain